MLVAHGRWPSNLLKLPRIIVLTPTLIAVCLWSSICCYFLFRYIILKCQVFLRCYNDIQNILDSQIYGFHVRDIRILSRDGANPLQWMTRWCNFHWFFDFNKNDTYKHAFWTYMKIPFTRDRTNSRPCSSSSNSALRSRDYWNRTNSSTICRKLG
jgi:hypothetical protein